LKKGEVPFLGEKKKSSTKNWKHQEKKGEVDPSRREDRLEERESARRGKEAGKKKHL